jgi:hypothetical protein
VLQEEAKHEVTTNSLPEARTLPAAVEPNGEVAAVNDALSDFWDSASRALATAELSAENSVPTADDCSAAPGVAMEEERNGDNLNELVSQSLVESNEVDGDQGEMVRPSTEAEATGGTMSPAATMGENAVTSAVISSDTDIPSEETNSDDIEAAVLQSLANQMNELSEMASETEGEGPIDHEEELSDDTTNAVLKALAGIESLDE